MKRESLFRPQVSQRSPSSRLGGLEFRQPLGVRVLVVVAAILAACILLFLSLASYTKKASVTGQLVPAGGISSVVSDRTGVVTSIFRREGTHVKKGDRLALVSVSHATMTMADSNESLNAQLLRRSASQAAQFEANRDSLIERRRALLSQLNTARTELSLIEAERVTRASQVAVAERRLARIQELNKEKFVSVLQVEQQESAVLDGMNQLRSLDRLAQSTKRGILQLELSRHDIAAQVDSLRAAHSEETSVLDQAKIENESRRQAVITAPVSGLIASQSAQLGQSLVAGQPIMSLLPDDSRLEAHLWVPSRAVGFVQEGSQVLVRYQAFPSAKFGRYRGHVIRISSSALSRQELLQLAEIDQPGEHFYRVVVMLDRQSVLAYGRNQPLRPGMLLDADILLERRSLVDWLLEPLYSIRGRSRDS